MIPGKLIYNKKTERLMAWIMGALFLIAWGLLLLVLWQDREYIGS